MRLHRNLILLSISFIVIGALVCFTGGESTNRFIPFKEIDLLQRTQTKVVFSADNGHGVFSLYLAESATKPPVSLPTPFEGDCITPVFSPDGLTILFSQFDGNHFRLVSLDVKTLSVNVLTNDDGDYYCPVWSQDGALLAFCKAPSMTLEDAGKAEIFVSDWPSFNPVQLTSNDRMDCYPVFLADGTAVVVESGKVDSLFGLFVLPLHSPGEAKSLLYEPSLSGNGIPHIYRHWMTFERCNAKSPEQFEVCVVDVEQPQRIKFLTNWHTLCNPTPRFSPDGVHVACHRFIKGVGHVVVMPFSASDGKSGAPAMTSGASSLMLPRWNRSSSVLIAEDWRNRRLAVLDPFDLKGTIQFILKDGYRRQRFMEIYNFDVN